MNSFRLAPLPLDAVLGNAPPSPVPDGAQAPSLRRIQTPFISLKVWKPKECARAIMRFLETEFNEEVFDLVKGTYRAWQLSRFCHLSPDKALRLVSAVRNYCLAPGDHYTSEVPLRPPPFGYNDCPGCWDSLNNAQKRIAWRPFWIATGQVTMTDIGDNCGGGGSGAGAAGNGP